jgi:hypothetical protein
MKLLFSKFRISSALDSGKPVPPGLRRKAASTPGLRQYAEDALALERTLKAKGADPEAPASLHAAIMRAVRQSEQRPAASPVAFLRWAAPSALAVAALSLGLWWYLQPASLPPNAQPASSAYAAVSDAFNVGNQFTRKMPALVTSPLSSELDRMNRDVDKTAELLLASFP